MSGYYDARLIALIPGQLISRVITIAGVGTIITAFFMGPLIEFFNVHITRLMLREKET